MEKSEMEVEAPHVSTNDREEDTGETNGNGMEEDAGGLPDLEPAMEEDVEEKMKRIHEGETANGTHVVIPSAPEEAEEDNWKIDGMSIEELEALEQLEEAEEELRKWRANKCKTKHMKKQSTMRSKKSFRPTPIPMYNCEICGYTYSKLGTLQKHWKEAHNPNAKYKCPECPKALASRQSIKKHMLSHRPENDWPVSCELCEKRFPGIQELEKHFKTPLHKEDEKVKPGSESLRDILNRCETKQPPEIDNETIIRVKTVSKKKYKSLFEKRAPVKVITQAKAMSMKNENISLVSCKLCNRVFLGKDKYYDHTDECTKQSLQDKEEDDEIKVEKQVGFQELPFMGHYEKVKPVRNPAKMKAKYRDVDRDYIPRGLSDSASGKLRKCTFCSNLYDKTSNMKNHTLNHFLEKIKAFLPKNKPFQCPTCGLIQRDIITLARHYAFTHKNVYNYCSEEELRGTPVGGGTEDDDGDYKGKPRHEENKLLGHQVDTQDQSDSEEEDFKSKTKNSTANVTSKRKDCDESIPMGSNSEEKEKNANNEDESGPGSPASRADTDENLEDFANSELEGVEKDEKDEKDEES